MHPDLVEVFMLMLFVAVVLTGLDLTLYLLQFFKLRRIRSR